MQEINYENISFPMKIESLPRFETLNQNISINVFGYDVRSKHENYIIPLYISNYLDMRTHEINLLLLHNGIRSHYIGIISQFLTIFNKKHILAITDVNCLLNKANYKNAISICLRCFRFVVVYIK